MEDTDTLKKVFLRCEEVITSLSNGSISEEQRKETQSCLEDITRQVSILGLFSDNEHIDELPTSSVCFLLLPAYLGALRVDSRAPDRLAELEAAEVYFKDFLKRCKNYEVLKKDVADCIDASEESGSFVMKQTSQNPQNSRQQKIQRFKDQKLLQEKIKELESRRKNSQNVEEEDIRTLYLTRIQWWGQNALDELSSVEEEKSLVKHRESILQGTGEPAPSSSSQSASSSSVLDANAPKLKPIILTRTKMQKEVFGLGYPSVPTMTIEEWFDNFYGPQHQVTEAQASCSEESGAAGEDPESDEAVMKAREMDEYKDTHRRGWGNTYNKG